MAAKKKARGGRPKKGSGPSKSGFIRDLLAKNMSPAEIVEKGKEAGLAISPVLVYKVRGREGLTKSGGGPGRPGRKPSTGAMSASDFVRSFPAGARASEVVSAGAEKGIAFTANLVYAVRAAQKKGGSATAPRAKRALVSGGSRGSSTEGTFRRLAFDLGLGRARELIDELEARLGRLLDGE
jgi:hypothetical protein